MGFGKDSKERAMFGELYRLFERYWDPTPAELKSDWWWDVLISEADQFSRNYFKPTDTLSRDFMVLLVQRCKNKLDKIGG